MRCNFKFGARPALLMLVNQFHHCRAYPCFLQSQSQSSKFRVKVQSQSRKSKSKFRVKVEESKSIKSWRIQYAIRVRSL